MQKDEKVQVYLKSGTATLTAWVDKDVKVGYFITLKDSDDPSRKWLVVYVSEPKKAELIRTNRDWKVGGLTGQP